MDERDWLAERFEAHRPHLRAVAYRMLGSPSEADDAVQEAWLRLSRSDADAIENLGGWLTTVVGRVSLDMLRSRRSRREEPAGVHAPQPGIDRQWEVVDAFIAAAREGKFEALLELLDPDVVLRADGGVLRAAESQVVHGAQAVIEQARRFRGLTPHGKPALVNGAPGV